MADDQADHSYSCAMYKPVPTSTRKRGRRYGKMCCVYGCTGSNADGISVHCFPSKRSLRRQWVNFVKRRRADFKAPNKHTVICERHFSPDCYPLTYKLQLQLGFEVERKQLLPGSVPTIHVVQTRPTTTGSTSATAPQTTHCVGNISRRSMAAAVLESIPKQRAAYRKRERQRVINELLAKSGVGTASNAGTASNGPMERSCPLQTSSPSEPNQQTVDNLPIPPLKLKQETVDSLPIPPPKLNQPTVHILPIPALKLNQQTVDNLPIPPLKLKQPTVDSLPIPPPKLNQPTVDSLPIPPPKLNQPTVHILPIPALKLNQPTVDNLPIPALKLNQQTVDNLPIPALKLNQQTVDNLPIPPLKLKQETVDKLPVSPPKLMEQTVDQRPAFILMNCEQINKLQALVTTLQSENAVLKEMVENLVEENDALKERQDKENKNHVFMGNTQENETAGLGEVHVKPDPDEALSFDRQRTQAARLQSQREISGPNSAASTHRRRLQVSLLQSSSRISVPHSQAGQDRASTSGVEVRREVENSSCNCWKSQESQLPASSSVGHVTIKQEEGMEESSVDMGHLELKENHASWGQELLASPNTVSADQNVLGDHGNSRRRTTAEPVRSQGLNSSNTSTSSQYETMCVPCSVSLCDSELDVGAGKAERRKCRARRRTSGRKRAASATTCENNVGHKPKTDSCRDKRKRGFEQRASPGTKRPVKKHKSVHVSD